MSALRPAAFLDRDGVLNVDRGYAYRLDDLELVPGAAEGVCCLNTAGILVVVVTNQSGIGRGYYSEADMVSFNHYLCEQLLKEGAHVDAFYFCPYHPDAAIEAYRADHPDRKPRPGMIIRAFKDLHIDPDRSFLIGDKTSDIEAAKAAGIQGYLFNGKNLNEFISKIMKTRLASKV